VAGFALALPVAAKDVAIGAAVDVRTTVNAVREVPAGNPLPGLHIDAKVKGRLVDIYIAPVDFARRYDVKVAKGQDVHIVGTEVKEGEVDVVLAREITTGAIDRLTGIFHENMTIYLRNDEGPLW
jgi:RecB family exonuclease